MTRNTRMLRATAVQELVARWPHLEALLLRHGIDTCCGGPLALEEAAQAHEVPVDLLLAEVAEAIAEAAVKTPQEA
jgi:iron-sulfur cluster repair protein YtfE (RIC family)